MFQTLHRISLAATTWLLKLLASLLVLLGQFSPRIARIAQAFPATLYKRTNFIEKELELPTVKHYVVCSQCLDLYDFSDCFHKHGSRLVIKSCKCRSGQPLLKRVISCKGNQTAYPYMVYPYTSLISSLKSLLSRSGLLKECENWRQQNMESVGAQVVSDVFQGQLWREFLECNGTPFLSQKYSIIFMLNVDWFQPFKHREYSVGVMYLAVMNLPQQLRYKRENLGIFQGPFEPSKEINNYLKPFVDELLQLWDGIAIKTNDCGTQTIRGALLFVCCDLPASNTTKNNKFLNNIISVSGIPLKS